MIRVETVIRESSQPAQCSKLSLSLSYSALFAILSRWLKISVKLYSLLVAFSSSSLLLCSFSQITTSRQPPKRQHLQSTSVLRTLFLTKTGQLPVGEPLRRLSHAFFKKNVNHHWYPHKIGNYFHLAGPMKSQLPLVNCIFQFQCAFLHVFANHHW